jgi:predicted CoA-binding protein
MGGAIMPSGHEEFWNHTSYALVANSAVKPFPKLSYGELKKQGRKVFAVDPSVAAIAGDTTYPDLESLPEKVEAVVLETPQKEIADWVTKAADAGVRSIWIHMGRDTPEALAIAKERGVEVLTGTCAVMYIKPGLSYHSIHKWINQLTGRY